MNLDTSGRYTPKGSRMATLAPGEPFREALIIRYGVCFLDRVSARRWAPRAAWLDYLPLVWTRLDPGPDGYLKRTWKLEQGASGPVYREQAPAPFERPEKLPAKGPGSPKGGPPPRAGYGAGNTKRSRRGQVDVVSLDDEEAWTNGPDRDEP